MAVTFTMAVTTEALRQIPLGADTRASACPSNILRARYDDEWPFIGAIRGKKPDGKPNALTTTINNGSFVDDMPVNRFYLTLPSAMPHFRIPRPKFHANYGYQFAPD
jgi:hypothetical protein